MSKNILVVGLGEIGRPIYDMLYREKSWKVFGYDEDKKKTIHDFDDIPKKIFALHVCIPCGNVKKFKDIICDFICDFEPKLLVIHSTVPPLTTKSIWSEIYRICPHVAHSPVRGTHTQMFEDIQTYTKFIGGVTPEASKKTFNHLTKAGFKCKIMGSSTNTELAKLFETTYVAVMIATFQEMHRISKTFDIDFSEIFDIFIDTQIHRLDRPIFYPSTIEGHCLMPNIDLLNSVTKSLLLKWVSASNELRKVEMEDPEIAKEVEKCKKKFDAMRKWSVKVLGEAGKI